MDGEKTPSFFVHRDRQFWHCFGCNEGGDVISFYQKIESLDFPDALADLATRVVAGMRPKLEACVRAVTQGVPQAHIIDGRQMHSLLLEVFTSEGIGTMIVPDSQVDPVAWLRAEDDSKGGHGDGDHAPDEIGCDS